MDEAKWSSEVLQAACTSGWLPGYEGPLGYIERSLGDFHTDLAVKPVDPMWRVTRRSNTPGINSSKVSDKQKTIPQFKMA